VSSRAREFLRRAFAVVREDVPQAWTEMVARAPLLTSARIDDERLMIERTAESLEVAIAEGCAQAPDVRVETTTASLLAVLDGKTTLLAALIEGSIFIAGDVAALAEAQVALLAFLQGCVRTRRTIALLSEFRSDCDAAAARKTLGREAA
jgi:hypothetical protein